jgi:hypothetical protein
MHFEVTIRVVWSLLRNLPLSRNGSPSSSSISTPSIATATLLSRSGSVSESEVVVKDLCHDTQETEDSTLDKVCVTC